MIAVTTVVGVSAAKDVLTTVDVGAADVTTAVDVGAADDIGALVEVGAADVIATLEVFLMIVVCMLTVVAESIVKNDLHCPFLLKVVSIAVD